MNKTYNEQFAKNKKASWSKSKPACRTIRSESPDDTKIRNR